MIDSAVAWGLEPGPPNWIFVVALLSTPHLWSRYAKESASRLFERYLGGDTQP